MISKLLRYSLLLLSCALAGESASPKALPTLSLQELAGKSVNTSAWKGKVVLVDFWATWCVACRASIPILNNLQQRYAAQGLQIAAISIDEDKSLAEKFTRKAKMAYPVFHDPKDQTSAPFVVKSLPTLLLFGKDGKLLYRTEAIARDEEARLEKLIQKELEAK